MTAGSGKPPLVIESQSQGGKDSKGRCEAVPRDPTLAFSVRDPALSSVGFISPPLKLYALKQHLQEFTLASSNDPAGFNFENFSHNIRGLKYASLGGRGYEVLFTRSSAFLTFHGQPSELLALQGILGADAKERVSYATSPASGGLTICRLTVRELKAIVEASSPGKFGAFAEGSILPPESAESIEPSQLRARLSQCEVLETDGRTDFADFISRISLVQICNDDGCGNYIIGVRGDELLYMMYVNKAAQEQAQNPLICRLRFNNDVCEIYRIEVVG